ncbi:hypothetical protein NDU88_007221 [Pleurodeles waltl]|uniref:Uncharacterized protein n=1 Tax=Pleurodeles waltl TaxID=8319 RepID=A0AAV7VP41_PLEWA|nr:hypothetical protein NDU88_007221 [Pleurodeles waltl]
MPGGRSSTKNSGKLARQLLFSEALLHSKAPSSAPMAQPPVQHHNVSDTAQEPTMDFSKGTQARSKETRRIRLPPGDYCLFPPPYAGPTDYTKSTCPRILSDGRSGNPDVADFSKETSERRRAFLALRPRLRQMEVKYCRFELV